MSREEFERSSSEIRGTGKLLSGTMLGKTKEKTLAEARLAMSEYD